MSDTPRTDAEIIRTVNIYTPQPDGSKKMTFELVPASVARQLERELNAAHKPDPIADLCEKIKQDIRYCDHGYIHITCGQCVAPWLRG